MHVTGIDLALLSFPLPHPVRFGPVEYRTRDHVALRLRTDEPQLAGFALGYTRGTPLLEAAGLLAPDVVGCDPLRPRAVAQALAAARRAGQAALGRALSLIELALWDVVAKAARLPLATLLGGAREEIPALAVGGYFLDVRGEEAIVADLVELERAGFADLKLMLAARPASELHALVGRVRAALSAETRLGVDLHYSLAGRHDAAELLHALDGLGLAFVEDPLPPAEHARLVDLATRLRTPLALGEDVTSPLDYAPLLRAAAILRVDPTTCGGLGAALAGIELAAARGAPVVPHGFHGVSAQLAGGHPQVSHVEYVPPALSGDRLGDVLAEPFALRAGRVVLDGEPGNGLRLDWDAVLANAARTSSTPAR